MEVPIERRAALNMLNPSIEEMLDRKRNPEIESKFELINMISRRSRQLNDGAIPLTQTEDVKPVSIAMWEVKAGKIVPVKKEVKKEE
jgi:DNA-directed RNA polymerase omega subunit